MEIVRLKPLINWGKACGTLSRRAVLDLGFYFCVALDQEGLSDLQEADNQARL